MGTNEGRTIAAEGSLGGGVAPSRPASAAGLELGRATRYRVARTTRPEARAGDLVIRW